MDDDDILERVRRGVGGIHPDHGAADLVHRQVRRRRRRRRVVGGVATAVVVVAAVPAALLAGDLRGDEVPPAVPTPTDTFDGTRPAAFFFQTMGGGQVSAQLNRFNAAKGQRYWARFIWFAPVEGGAADEVADPALAGAAVERYDDTYDGAGAVAACDRYAEEAEAAGGTASCTDLDGEDGVGGVALTAEVVAGNHHLDVVNQRGRLGRAGPDDLVNTATVFRDDGWAVTLTLCACAPWGRPDAAAPPATAERLAEAAADPDWVPDPVPDGG